MIKKEHGSWYTHLIRVFVRVFWRYLWSWRYYMVQSSGAPPSLWSMTANSQGQPGSPMMQHWLLWHLRKVQKFTKYKILMQTFTANLTFKESSDAMWTMWASHTAFLTFWITFASFEVVVSQRVTSLRMKSCEQGGKLSAAENKRSLILISAPLLPPLLTLLPDTAIIAGRTCKQGTSGARTGKTLLRGFCSLSLNQYLFRNVCKKHRHK